MPNKNSIQYVLKVALALCIVCSVIVSTAAVILKPLQDVNRELDYKRNVLSAALMLRPDVSIEEQFEKVEMRLVELETGQFSDAFAPESYDSSRAVRDPNLSSQLPRDQDIAGIGRIEQYARVFFGVNEQGEELIILPVRGYGLWSTLYGFLAVESDYNTVVGLTFYEHGETPGLGGEVDNPRWIAQWEGKEIYDEEGNVAIEVLKGTVDPGTPGIDHKVDGLAGATLTSRGVTDLLRFWLGDRGYKPFLENLKKGEA